jgi:hypothetical protein
MKIPKSFLRSTALFLAVLMLFSACASTTLIQSIPSGARVYIDHEPVGETPYLHADTKITGSATYLRLQKDGYDDFNHVIVRDEQVDVGALVGGIFVLIPFLWIMGYKPVRTYELTPSR